MEVKVVARWRCINGAQDNHCAILRGTVVHADGIRSSASSLRAALAGVPISHHSTFVSHVAPSVTVNECEIFPQQSMGKRNMLELIDGFKTKVVGHVQTTSDTITSTCSR